MVHLTAPLLADGKVIMWLLIADWNCLLLFFAEERGLFGLDPGLDGQRHLNPWTIPLDQTAPAHINRLHLTLDLFILYVTHFLMYGLNRPSLLNQYIIHTSELMDFTCCYTYELN